MRNEKKQERDRFSCPICGELVQNQLFLVAIRQNQHRCNQRTLNAIDAAHQKDDEPHPRSLNMTTEERYKDGFGLFGRKKEDNR